MTFIRLRLLLHCGTLPNVKIGIKERKIVPDSFWGTASSEAPLLRVPVHQNAKCPVRDRLENPPSIPKRRPGLWLPNRLQPNPTMKGGWRSPQQPPCSDGAGEETRTKSFLALTMPSHRRELRRRSHFDSISDTRRLCSPRLSCFLPTTSFLGGHSNHLNSRKQQLTTVAS